MMDHSRGDRYMQLSSPLAPPGVQRERAQATQASTPGASLQTSRRSRSMSVALVSAQVAVLCALQAPFIIMLSAQPWVAHVPPWTIPLIVAVGGLLGSLALVTRWMLDHLRIGTLSGYAVS